MKFRHAFWLIAILSSLARGQSADALRNGALEIWTPRNHTMGIMGDPAAHVTVEYPWEKLLSEFQGDFPGFDLRFKILDREDYLRAAHSSAQNPVYPDVMFEDNGRELDPLHKSNAVIQLWGESRFRFDNGWWLMFRNSKNLPAARAFLLWLSRSPTWKPWPARTPAMPPAELSVVQTVARNAAQSFERRDPRGFSQFMDPEATQFDWGFDEAKTVERVEPLVTFGNSRLAFVLVSAVRQGAATFGMTHSGLILRKVEDRWRVLLFLRGGLPYIEGLFQTFDNRRFLDGTTEVLAKVSLLSPPDHARIGRYPRGQLEWAALDPLPATYVIESQFGQPGQERWSSSAIVLVRPTSGAPSMRKEIPFGVGQQPHRWRIWAIGPTGVVSLSAWRTIDFTD